MDSFHLCGVYHTPMHMLLSTPNNIKITNPVDYYIFQALYDYRQEMGNVGKKKQGWDRL